MFSRTKFGLLATLCFSKQDVPVKRGAQSGSRALWALLLTGALAACGGGNGSNPPADQPQSPTGTTGTLLRTTELSTLSVPYLKSVFDSLPELADLPGPQRNALAAEIQYGVRLVAFEYTTTGPAGEARKASALAMLPTTPGASVGTLAYMHGTSTKRDFIPSVGDYDENVPPAVLFAARGRFVVSPDYLGLGASDLPYHPYLQRATLAAAGRDALTAGVELARRNSLALDGNLFIAGYSEGGFAAAALQRRLQQAPLQALGLRGTMSIAGPLDSLAWVKSTLSADPATGRDSGRSIYTAFTAWSYQRVYGDLYSQATEVFNAPYAGQLDALFDGTRSGDEIGAALPASPRMLLTATALTATLSGSNQIAARIRGNDVIDVNPASPLISCHGTLDDTVPYSITVAARERLAARGASLIVLEQNGKDHGSAYGPCILEAVRMFR